MNYFELFSLQPIWQIEEKPLRKAYYQAIKECQADTEKQTLINKAYEVLKNSFSRLEYILSLQKIDTTQYTLPKAFLMEMIEWNEQLEEAQTIEALDLLKQEMERLEQTIIQELEQINYLENPNWGLVQEKYFFLKYILRNKENIRNIAL